MADTEDDEPLDPAVERVRRKLMTLLLVSSGIMGLGFLAVLLAIVWRVSNLGEPEVEAAAAIDLDISGGDVRAASVDGDRLVMTIGGAEPRIEVRRLSDGALVQTIRLAP